jgi:hypothetical protein
VSEVAAADEAAGARPDDDDDGFDFAWLIAWVLAMAFVVFAAIGAVTMLGWIFPG